MLRAVLARHRHILIVDRPDSFHRALIGRIEAEITYSVETVDTALSGMARATAIGAQFDAIVLAADLPDGDGVDLCGRMRQRGVNVPILLLAEAASEAEVVHGLDAGANDFITTPFRPAEVLARLRAQIRAHETSEDVVLTIGPFQFRPARRQLQNRETNERIRLTEKEAAVLKYLYRAPGPVPRNTLLHEVWGYNAGATTHTVETHIYRLRRKIEPDPTRIGLLVNEEGGYRLRAEPQAASRAWPSPAHHAGDVSRFASVEREMAAV